MCVETLNAKPYLYLTFPHTNPPPPLRELLRAGVCAGSAGSWERFRLRPGGAALRSLGRRLMKKEFLSWA